MECPRVSGKVATDAEGARVLAPPYKQHKVFAIIQYDGKNIQEPSHAAIVDSFQLSCIHKILSCRIPFSFPSRSIMSY